jgi:HK97 family phage prohead protease
MKETRTIKTSAKVELRDDGTVGTIVGYPIVYNKDSEDMGFIERIAPGAAKKALKRSDIRGLKNHDPSLIFARQGVNLTFVNDKHGLRYEATPIDTRNFREIADEVRLGLLTGQSFGFTIKSDEWEDLDTDHPTRTITEIDQIFDVGPVTYPAYQDTTVALRSLEKAKDPGTILDPAEDDGVITINKVTYTGGDRFDRAVEKIESLRSLANPTIPTDDSDPDEPTLEKSGDEKDIMERIKNTLDKHDEV